MAIVLAAGLSVVTLIAFGQMQSGAEAPASEATLKRIAASNGNAATVAATTSRQRSQASAAEADARIMREAEAAD
jgi:hypothetical protein